MSYLANPRRLALEAYAEAMTPPPPVDLVAWAERRIAFGEESPFPGPYNHDRFPFFRRVLEVLSPDYPAAMVVLLKSAQIGGTVVAQVAIAGIVELAPQPILMAHPNDGNAKKWLRSKFRPIVKRSAALSGLMQPEGARSGYNATYWERRDGRGSIQMASAQSPVQLSMMSYRYQVQDDLAKWDSDNGAGDPEQQADSRTKAFLRFGGKVVKISTPLVEPGCRITRAYKQGTRERWHVPCPHCGEYQALEWETMLAALDEAHPERAHFPCIHCGAAIEQMHRDAINARGRWVAENPGAAVVSFYLWAAYSPLESWENIARAWLRAKGSPDAERVFYNDTVGRAQQTTSAAPQWESLRDRAEALGLPRGVVPAGFPILTVGVDCQDNRIEWQAVAWGPRLRRCVIDIGVIDDPITSEDGQAALTDLLMRRWPTAAGGEREIDLLSIDGNAFTSDVYAWYKRRRSSRVMVVRGAHGDNRPPLERVAWERGPSGKPVRTSKRWFNVGVSGLKASLYAHLGKPDPMEMGAVLHVDHLGDDYYQQLTSEVRKSIRRGDAQVWRWVLPAGLRNEMLDTHIYATAAAIKRRWMVLPDQEWARLIAERDAPPAGVQPSLLSLLTPAPAPSSAPAPASVGPGPGPGPGPGLGDGVVGVLTQPSAAPAPGRQSIAEKMRRLRDGR